MSTETSDLIRLIEINAYSVYTGTLIGNAPPAVKELFQRLKAPRPGDLVLEITTLLTPAHDGERLGRLLRDVREPVFTPEQLESYTEEGEDISDPYFSRTERVCYIQTMDGREIRWCNAKFIAVADSFDFGSEAGERAGEE